MKQEQWDVEMSHSRTIQAPPALVWRSLFEVRGTDLPVAGAFLQIRDFPGRLAGRVPAAPRSRTLFERAEDSAFGILSKDEDRLVEMARIARFWEPVPTNGPVVADRAEFDAFRGPGFAKTLISFELTPLGVGTRVVTTTRVATTDSTARRRFLVYWYLIGRFAGVLRTAMLAAMERRALALASGAA